MKRHVAILAALLLVAACSDDQKSTGDNDVRTEGPDGGTPDSTGSDTTTTTVDTSTDMRVSRDMKTPARGCAAPPPVDTTYALDSEGPSGQLYARATYDGENIWVVYNRPSTNGGSGESIMIVRLACDGNITLGPLQISDPANADTRNYQPAIASGDGLIYAAWVSQPDGLNPKGIFYRGFRRNGTMLSTTAADITPMGGAEPISETIWELDIAVLPGDEAVVVGSSGDFGLRQVVAQRFGSDGTRIGDPMFPYLNKELNQVRPTVAAGDDGTIYVAWTQSKPADAMAGTPEQPELSVFTTIPPGATTGNPNPPPPSRPLLDPSPISRLGKQLGPDGAVFLAFQETSSSVSDIHLRLASDIATTETATFRTLGQNNFRPSVTGSPSGGAVAWYRYATSPIDAQVVVQGFDFDGAAYAQDAEIVIPMTDKGIPPYGPAITHIEGNTYFVAWSEGASAPETRVMGRFVGTK